MHSNDISKKAQSHQRILQAASRKVRRAGFHGLGVAEVMKAAGLTHGGFYAHFPSRDALLADAVLHASQELGAVISTHVEAQVRQGQTSFTALVEGYLADDQIRNCEEGCPVAALCSEMPSQSLEVRDASRRIVANLHRLVQVALPPGAPKEAAWTVAGALVGALQLARALGDNAEGKAVLAAARAQLIAHYDEPQ